MRALYSLKAWLNFLFKDTKNYLKNVRSQKKMRTAKDLEKYDTKEFELDKTQSEDLETATFALGCFWGPDAVFGGLEGVVKTRVGYTGGEKENPTYRSLGSHTETIQIDYNPAEISYNALLEIFWKNHNPQRKQKTQYASKIFYIDEDQREKARNSLDDEKGDSKPLTSIEPLKTFWVAEDYHQKYYLRQHKKLERKLTEVYNPEEFINSTVAARLNGLVSGKQSVEIDKLKLPENILELLD